LSQHPRLSLRIILPLTNPIQVQVACDVLQLLIESELLNPIKEASTDFFCLICSIFKTQQLINNKAEASRL
jgi:hypothetical protein